MTDDFQVIYVAGAVTQAHLLAGALRDRGFDAFVTNDGLQLGLGALPFGTATAPRVVVPAADAEEARRMVLELVDEKPHEPRPIQFRMRTLLYVVTGISVFLAIDRSMGWSLSANFGAVCYAVAGLFFLLVIIPSIFRKRRERREELE
jgi:membrane protein YdbS with pleckstrin-like domain